MKSFVAVLEAWFLAATVFDKESFPNLPRCAFNSITEFENRCFDKLVTDESGKV